MVACTTLGFPYQEGSDMPCGMSEIWCLFTDLVEAQLLGVNNIVNRTAVSTPHAKVIKTIPEILVPNVDTGVTYDSITWDGVEIDNDNMVDLSADPLHVFVRRPGIYLVDTLLHTETVGPVTNVNIEVRVPESSVIIDHYIASRYTSPSPGNRPHLLQVVEVTAADFVTYLTPSFSTAVSWAITSASINVISAEMTVTWIAEAVN